MKKAKAWIDKKLSQGVNRDYLLHTVGCFSNKAKAKVMREKNISSFEYEKRYSFLSKVYYLLSGGE